MDTEIELVPQRIDEEDLMRSVATLVGLLMFVAAVATADPVNGVFRSTDLGGQMLTGRASTWRPDVNVGLPQVLHVQSYDAGTAQLGAQWELACAIETIPYSVQDNRVNGTGTVVYTAVYNGGTLTFFPGSPAWPWGDGVATLGTTTLISTVQYVSNIPVASVVNGNTSGLFTNGCALVFAIGNGSGVGETPYASKPADYPTFLDGTCAPADPGLQFGTWGSAITITFQIDCVTPTRRPTWGALKTLYR
jgi:hypothetical protein